MTIQAIGKTSYLIVVSEEELIKNSMSVEKFTKADAEKLYKMAMPKPLRTGVSVCLEVYQGKDEIMIFVRFSGEEIVAFAFDNFEEMLTAVKCCPEMSGSELLYDGGQYILILTPWDGDTVPEGIYEFGERIDVQPHHLPWLREHCVKIIAGKAIETLLNVF